MRRIESQIKTICGLHQKLSEKYLQLSDQFRELDFQEVSLQFQVKYGFGWKKEMEQFRRECTQGKCQPQVNAWKFGVQVSKQWSIFQKMSSMVLQKDLGLPAHLLRKTSESLEQRTFASQEMTNVEYIFEQKKLRAKKKKLLHSKGVKDWGVCESVHRRDQVIRGLEKGENWGWGLMCWQQSSLMRHLKGLFENSNSGSFLQLENLQMLENSMIVDKLKKIKNIFTDNLKLLVNF